MNAMSSPSWLQFRIRTLLLAVAMAGVVMALLAEGVRQAKRQQAAVVEIARLGGFVIYDHQYHAFQRAIESDSSGFSLQHDESRLTQSLGYDYRHTVFQVVLNGFAVSTSAPNGLAVYHCTDDDLSVLNALPRLRDVIVRFHPITDDGLRHLSGLLHLKELTLYGTDITDAGLKHLRPLTELRVLNVGGTKVSIEGLRSLPQLAEVWISKDQIQSAGGATQLEHVLPGVHFVEVFESPTGGSSIRSPPE
jgi:hypothetical protein